MVRQRNPNIEILTVAVDRLGPVADEMVFLGGCATGLLITDPAAPSIRVTTDVDVITEVASLRDYYQLAERLGQRGFVEDQSQGAPICRWKLGSTILDVMPTKPDLLGFGNQWYEPAVAAAESVELPSGKSIRMVLAPYFLATKLEAFDGRGKGDYLSSQTLKILWQFWMEGLNLWMKFREQVNPCRPIWLTDLQPCWKVGNLLRLLLGTCRVIPRVRGECR